MAAPNPTPTPTYTRAQLASLVLCVAIGTVLWFSPPPDGLSLQAWHTFAVFATTIVSFILRPLPMGPAVLVGLIVLAATGTLAPPDAANPMATSFSAALVGFGDSTSWLVIAAFLISGAMIRSGLGRRVSLTMVVWLGRSVLGLGYAIGAAECVLAPFIPSNTARGGGVMAPIVHSLCHVLESRPDENPRHAGEFLVLCGAHLNLVTAAMFLTGMAANPLVAEAAEKFLGVQFTWGTWLLGSAVPGVLSLIVLPPVLYGLSRPQLIDAGAARQHARVQLDEMGVWRYPELVMAVTFVTMLVLWCTASWHHLPTGLVAMMGVAVLVVTGAEQWKDIVGNSAAWDALIWLGGLISMSEALRETGFAAWFASSIEGQLGGLGPVAVAVVLALIYFYSMYAYSMLTGHIVAMVGVFFAVAAATGTPPLLIVALLAYFSNLCGSTTFYSTGPVVIYFGLGYVASRRWLWIGFLVSLLHMAIWLGIGLPYWKLLGWW